jgi:hypothetical protein
LRSVRRKSFEAVLNTDQIAERVPARKDHDRIVARRSGWPGSQALC